MKIISATCDIDFLNRERREACRDSIEGKHEITDDSLPLELYISGTCRVLRVFGNLTMALGTTP
jgi:hypothetical protein